MVPVLVWLNGVLVVLAPLPNDRAVALTLSDPEVSAGVAEKVMAASEALPSHAGRSLKRFRSPMRWVERSRR